MEISKKNRFLPILRELRGIKNFLEKRKTLFSSEKNEGTETKRQTWIQGSFRATSEPLDQKRPNEQNNGKSNNKIKMTIPVHRMRHQAHHHTNYVKQCTADPLRKI